ncbi:methyltransferase [Candidatus Pacearchaeota archaeon]|nr:methyltransferase [Candidatus Pacearchaeota archaeon]
MKIYKPREDSFLLLNEILKQKKVENALDMGTGSGILALELAKISKKVIAVDINKESIKEFNKIIKKNKISNIKTINSDLFSKVFGKFDLMVFNPPYIPTKKGKIEFIDLDGGKNGTEIIKRFLKGAEEHLTKEGRILLLTTSLNKNIGGLFKKYGYYYKKLSEKKIFFEKLFVWELK